MAKMNKDREDILHMMKQLINSPERELAIQLESLRSSHRVFARNYRELVALLDLVETPKVAIALRDVKRRSESLRVLEEVMRLFHNFITSAKTLKDHTDTHMRRVYKGHAFIDEYKSKVAEHFACSPVQCFVQDLRNYTQHYSLPLTGSELHWDRTQGYRITYYVSTEQLGKWNKWSPKGRKYIQAFQDILPVKQLASDYFSLVDEFYAWLEKRQLEVNSDKLERLREMEKRFATLTERG